LPLSSPKIRAVIQARFGSRRFPGKVLEEFHGKKVLAHVLEAAGQACGRENTILATSDQSQDDAVANFAEKEGWAVHRGSLEDVWSRFRDIAATSGADWIVRICADSPLMSTPLIRTMIQLVRPDLDLITNIHPRTFPRGQSVEIIHQRLFREEFFFPQTSSDREHVTPHLYRIPSLRILNHLSPLGDQSREAWSVEEPGDIERLEKLCRR
jgi:spore coat polysaccharide biosynthesis protein SpsF